MIPSIINYRQLIKPNKLLHQLYELSKTREANIRDQINRTFHYQYDLPKYNNLHQYHQPDTQLTIQSDISFSIIYIDNLDRRMIRQDNSNENIQIYTKIQQAQPSYCSILSNKQVGFQVHIQTDKVYKVKNCVDSQKNNSELYKRFSKDFITNVKRAQDQMILCCGLQEGARIETSIGCKKNPGIFLIAGIAVLDQKYQQDFTKFDIQVSFIEYNDGKIYDLLSYTKVPLKMLKKQEGTSFGQTYCKISTFNQFLKLFRIALFNNKQRDQKIQYFSRNINTQQKVKTSIIMTILTKKYSSFLKNSVTQVQRNVVIDFAGSRPSGFTQQINNSINNNMGVQKNVWDYILIQLNNLTCKKKLHYHLVQPNPLLCITKNFIKNHKTFILTSFSANPQIFQENYKYFSELHGIVESIVKQIQPNAGQTLSINASLRDKSEFLMDSLLSQKQMTQLICQNITEVYETIKNRKYQSLRQYREIKQKIVSITKNCSQWFVSYRKLFCKMLQNKRLMKLSQNQIVADQMKLIGMCIKSDHYKDFYQAKGYLALEREINIKTQQSKQKLIRLIKGRYQLKDKLNELRSKNIQFIQSFSNDHGQFTGVKHLVSKIIQFFSIIFYNIAFFSQRTIADEIIKQQSINQNLNQIARKINFLENQINQMAKKGNILFQVNQFKKDAHLAILVKQVQNIVRKQQKSMKKKFQKFNQTTKQNNNNPYQSKSPNKGNKFIKLPALSQKKISFQISGNIELQNILYDPTQDN